MIGTSETKDSVHWIPFGNLQWLLWAVKHVFCPNTYYRNKACLSLANTHLCIMFCWLWFDPVANTVQPYCILHHAHLAPKRKTHLSRSNQFCPKNHFSAINRNLPPKLSGGNNGLFFISIIWFVTCHFNAYKIHHKVSVSFSVKSQIML